jgi:hypothetical protein
MVHPALDQSSAVATGEPQPVSSGGGDDPAQGNIFDQMIGDGSVTANPLISGAPDTDKLSIGCPEAP